ncbi:MAG TPA: ankyrin repeat domain-containing protein [Chitinophagaceae bacterium]|nr:ankyrin repeat domain-containing protein [Chitinophagaceae bacterium]
MIQPAEMKLGLPMKLPNNVVSTTTKVWDTLVASKEGNLQRLKELASECPELVYAQYNYTPPVYFAVREGHTALVKYLLDLGALAPSYLTYPFQDTLLTIAEDRGYQDIAIMLKEYLADPSLCKYTGDNGEILYNRTDLELEFQLVVDKEDLERTGQLLKDHPEFALDETYFWGEGILVFAAKENNRKMVDLLMSYGAKVPAILKWTQFYYFERLDGATYMMEKGMNPNTKSWHHVTLLHDMAQKGFIDKAELLLSYGADINPVDEEYQSTPLGLAARWGRIEMVEFLLKNGADPNKSGAPWSTPLTWAMKKNHSQVIDILKQAGAA